MENITKLNSLPTLDEKINYCKTQTLDHTYTLYAGQLLIEDLKKTVSNKFSEVTEKCQIILDTNYVNFVLENKTTLDNMINTEFDNKLDYLAVSSFKKTYLLILNKEVMELPSQCYLRLAVFLYMPNLTLIKKTYDELCNQLYTHATPTIINAGMKRPQLSSCFLLTTEDNTENILDSVFNTGLISKYSGGVGICLSKLRHSLINHQLSGRGIKDWLKMYDSTVSAINQSGRRNGAAAVYLDVWHIDIFEFMLSKRVDIGEDSSKSTNLFYGILINDLFMERVSKKEKWILFCPNIAKDLPILYGEEFYNKYTFYEKLFYKNEIAGKEIDAVDLFREICICISLTGVPYILNKDAMNIKSNQKNLGTLTTSNLCAEIVEYTDENNIASCNLASVCLSKMYDEDNDGIDYTLLENTVRKIVRNLNIVIDKTYDIERIPQIKHSNNMNRPLGIGVQGFADLICLLSENWLGDEIFSLNHHIFETIYYSALDESNKISIELCKAYDNFDGSPLSKGLFQFDLWNEPIEKWKYAPKYDWEKLRKSIMRFGIYNSQLIALMPTVSTATITGNNDSFEPFTGLYYGKETLSGSHIHINKYLMKDLQDIWNYDTLDKIIEGNDSLKLLDISDDVKDKYKTAYEIPKQILINLSAARGKFVCQSQSLNHFIENPDLNIIASIITYGHKMGLKTISYYHRFKASEKVRPRYVKPICTSCTV